MELLKIDGVRKMANATVLNFIEEETHPFFSKKAEFTGYFDIPVIKPTKEIIEPRQVIPFSRAIYCVDNSMLSDCFICFYEDDGLFMDFLQHPKKYFPLLRKAAGIIAPDCSMYFDDPFVLNLIAVYMRNSIASFLQENGFYVVPNVRWGNEKTYTRGKLPEIVSFEGIPKNAYISIGTYGAVKTREEKEHFKKGLYVMLKTLTPKKVLVFGAMPDEIFGDKINSDVFIHCKSWTDYVHGGK